MTSETRTKTKAGATKRRTSLEKHREEVIALLLTGWKQEEVATKYKVNPSSVYHFVQRHADKLEALRAEVERRTDEYAITHQVNRIADAQLRRDLLDAVRQARASGGTGMETGIVARQYKSLGSGDFAETVEEYKVDTAFLAEWRANDRQVAEELDQLPRGKGGNTYIDKAILVRYIEGG